MSVELPSPPKGSSSREVKYRYTPEFVPLLHQLGVTLLVSTYQSGHVVSLGVHENQLQVRFNRLDRPMGLAVDPSRVAVVTRRRIEMLKSATQLAPQLDPPGTYTGCYLPRGSFHTGDLKGHEAAWGRQGLWVVNTLFSTLCTLHEDYSFVPRWQPKFISTLAPEDRCHLNGLAMDAGEPRYVTALAPTDEATGWRPYKATGGLIIDVPSGETVVRGLVMPHSPRVYGGRLWVLNSGRGTLEVVDMTRGTTDVVCALPGFVRGLDFVDHFALIGLSRIRTSSVFAGLPIAERSDELKCGVAAVDLRTGRLAGGFQFDTVVEETFAIGILPGPNAFIQGPTTESEENHADIWVLPRPGTSPSPESNGSWYAAR